MNSLERSLLEKVGNDNGWERILESDPEKVHLASARHPLTAQLFPGMHEGSWEVIFAGSLDHAELARGFPHAFFDAGRIEAWNHATLGALLHRAAELAQSMPTVPERDYETERARVFSEHPEIRGTEREARVILRIGQDIYRAALMRYWGGSCAVTGIDLPEVLRASHAKPWAECLNDAERLDVYNGFLLTANLDALFDTGLISFSDSGDLLVSPHISETSRRILGLDSAIHLRWISPGHARYLDWHRHKIWKQ